MIHAVRGGSSFARCRRAIAPLNRDAIMTRLKYIEIDGKRYLWRELLALRREQRKAHARLQQPTAFRAQRQSSSRGRTHRGGALS